ncbi:serine/threonine-protein kinase [Streptomyces catenulae]|uniref:Serine/threonine-protein kinase n=1 Tax=Streptomyces catenulae TaxID=66875 RepID=A0ABV2YXW8_9ACTN|nr:serine/threonine-protein kinase [Streptomyces catenulae]
MDRYVDADVDADAVRASGAGPGPLPAARRAAYAEVGARLSLLSDRALGDAVAAAPAQGSGIGGRRAEMAVAGRRVFVKRVPLTDLERRPEHLRSTANLFGLPVHYQYGVGSAGFGAWRELAAHLMTTAWVLGDAYQGFPLLYHWRVLPDRPPADFADEFGGIDGAVAHWEGSGAVRRRLEAIGNSSASLVLFLEHLPRTLADRFTDVREGAWAEPGGCAPYLWAERELLRGTAFMSAHGLVHFDTHFANLLTDGHRIYFTDFGLALSRDFDLTPEESAFLTDHLVYDRSYAPWHLLRHHLPAPVRKALDQEPFLKTWPTAPRPHALPPELTTLLDRHAPHATILDEFHRRLIEKSKRTRFPGDEVRRELRRGGG